MGRNDASDALGGSLTLAYGDNDGLVAMVPMDNIVGGAVIVLTDAVRLTGGGGGGGAIRVWACRCKCARGRWVDAGRCSSSCLCRTRVPIRRAGAGSGDGDADAGGARVAEGEYDEPSESDGAGDVSVREIECVGVAAAIAGRLPVLAGRGGDTCILTLCTSRDMAIDMDVRRVGDAGSGGTDAHVCGGVYVNPCAAPGWGFSGGSVRARLGGGGSGGDGGSCGGPLRGEGCWRWDMFGRGVGDSGGYGLGIGALAK